MRTLKKFGDTVRRFRDRKDWSQEDLAAASKLHRTYISGIERGVRNPTLTVIEKIAKALTVPISDLFKERADEK